MNRLTKSVILLTSSILLIVAGTRAFFSDREASADNRFTVGAVDLKVNNTCHYYQLTSSGYTDIGCPEVTGSTSSWELTDLQSGLHRFFNFNDVKPGDWGENTISLHIFDNNAWGCLAIGTLGNNDNGLTTPESKVDTTDGDGNGELAQKLTFFAWKDNNGNNIFEPAGGEIPLFTNVSGPASDVLNGKIYALADSSGGAFSAAMTEGNDYYLGVAWCAGTIQISQEGTISCDGETMANETQTDSLTTDVAFYIVQNRNKPDFLCSSLDLGELVSPAPSSSTAPSPSPSPSPSPLVSPSPSPSSSPNLITCATNADCDDGFPCTNESCVLGSCQYTGNNQMCQNLITNTCQVGVCMPQAPGHDYMGCVYYNNLDGVTCSDLTCGLSGSCNGYTCHSGICTSPSSLPSPSPAPSGQPAPSLPPIFGCISDLMCNDNNFCTVDTCNIGQGVCERTANPCDDANDLTLDNCDVETQSCKHYCVAEPFCSGISFDPFPGSWW